VPIWERLMVEKRAFLGEKKEGCGIGSARGVSLLRFANGWLVVIVAKVEKDQKDDG